MLFAKFSAMYPDSNVYSYRDSNNEELCVLGQFLISDVWNSSQTFINWIKGSAIESTTGSNITYLEKRGDKVFIRDLFEEEGPYFGYLISDFIQMLKDWDVVINARPKEIIITKDDNGKITIEGFGKREN